MYIGLDVDAKGIEIAETEDGEQYTSSHLPLEAFAAWLKHKSGALLAIEYTGRLAEPYLSLCADAGVQIFIIHSRARAATQQPGRRGPKTDPEDAKGIARALLLWHNPESRRLLLLPNDLFVEASLVQIAWQLRALIEARDRCISDRVRAGNRAVAAQRAGNVPLYDFFANQAEALTTEAVDKMIELYIKQHYSEQYAALLSVPGIGPVLAPRLISTLLPVERFESVKHMNSYVGFALIINESGGKTITRRKTQHSGHSELRALLYIAAVGQTKANNEHGEFYRRLVERGKPGKVAVVALAAKMLREAFAILCRGTSHEREATNAAAEARAVPSHLMTQSAYARRLGLSRQRVSQLVAEDKLPTALHNGKRHIINPETETVPR